MKRVVYTKRGGLEAIEIIEESAPTPKSDEVLIEVHRAGINFADLMMRQGLYGAAPDFPFTPGYEVSGVILATGKDVEGHEVGDRVVALTGFGGYAEQVVVAQERAWTLPDNVSFDAAAAMPNDTFIVATDRGIFHKLRQQNPGKTFIEAPTAGDGATCRSCAHCPWMAMNELRALDRVLSEEAYRNQCEIHVDPQLGERAKLPLDRMLAFQAG